MARGADTLGEQYAKERGIPIRYFPADWQTLGKSAGYQRNVQMAQYADALVAFWDGRSKGTKHMIDTAQRFKLDIRVVLTERGEEPQDTAVLLRMRFGSEESITEVHPCRADQQDTCRGQETTAYCHWIQ